MLDKRKRRNSAICIGTGLIALDLVTNGEEDSSPRVWAGGSCGNVLTILAYLGWNSYPVARLGDDAASETVAKDMAKYGVDFQYVSFDNDVQTPIIIQRIFIGRDGHATHRFYWKCPCCGNWLPRYRPIRLKDVRGFFEKSPKANCFYFDRVSPASLLLAEKARKQGATIIFEPTHIKEDPKFRKAMELCDVLKYSNECTIKLPRVAYESPAKLVVETLGAEGLRYRLRSNEKLDEWKLLPAFPIKNLKDSAGAGDWCTAGMIHILSSDGISFDSVSEKRIVESLRYGQALSALNCGFEGARGAMYGIKKPIFKQKIQSILQHEESGIPLIDSFSTGIKKRAQFWCPACQETSSKMNDAACIKPRKINKM